jgi:hypothetical protein
MVFSRRDAVTGALTASLAAATQRAQALPKLIPTGQ